MENEIDVITDQTVQVDVSDVGNNQLKVAWTFRGMRVTLPYLIRKGLVEEQAVNVRQSLQRLVQRYVNVEAGNMQKPPAQRERPRAGNELRELARAGHGLYQSLFFSDGLDTAQIRAKKWLSLKTAEYAQGGIPLRINFTVDSHVYVPWGLTYDADPEALPGGADGGDDIDIYQDFWCLKYKLATLYNRVLVALSDFDPSVPGDVLSVANKNIYERVIGLLEEGCGEEFMPLIGSRRQILESLGRFGEPVYSSEEFFEKWKSGGKKYKLLYIYSHANGSNVALDSEDQITVNQFQLNTVLPDDRSQSQSSCIVFFNGCDTATGDSRGGFLEATGGSVFSGFIGTETKVPDIFAFRFGLDFLYRYLYEGLPVFRIMDQLRRQHWPLGLIYSTCCDPNLRAGRVDEALELILDGNFSQIPRLGTSTI